MLDGQVVSQKPAFARRLEMSNDAGDLKDSWMAGCAVKLWIRHELQGFSLDSPARSDAWRV